MKKRTAITLITVVSIIVFLLIAGLVYFFKPGASDYGTFLKMRELQISLLEDPEVHDRTVTDSFRDYSMKLPPLYAFMFKARNLSLFLKSVESDRIEAATINQLEIGRETEDFFDYTFMIRARPAYNVPFFHGDALKALPGVTSALYMDFYSFEHTMDAESFFGAEIGKIEQAIELARPYWKHEGFGELTPHLDPYKSPWRLEIVEPENSSEDEKRHYFDTVLRCFSLYIEAYLNSVAAAEESGDPGLTEANEAAIRDFVSVLYQHDIAVRLGRMIFPEEDFDRYFLDGFWGVGDLHPVALSKEDL